MFSILTHLIGIVRSNCGEAAEQLAINAIQQQLMADKPSISLNHQPQDHLISSYIRSYINLDI